MPKGKRDEFSFEDQAGVYEQGGESRLFAVCTNFTDAEGLKVLPRGRYLCADCVEEERGRVLAKLMDTAKSDYGAEPGFALQLIVLSGILQWNYQVQIPIP